MFAGRHLPLDVVARVAQYAASPVLAGVCRTWRQLLWGRYLAFRPGARTADAASITQMLTHTLRCVADGAGHLCGLDVRGDCAGVDASLLLLAVGANAVAAAAERCVSLRSLRLVWPSEAPSQPWSAGRRALRPDDAPTRAVTRLLRAVRSLASLRTLALDDGGLRVKAGVWSQWAPALVQAVAPGGALRRLELTIGEDRGGAVDERALGACLLCLVRARGLSDLTLCLDGGWAAPWLAAVRQAAATDVDRQRGPRRLSLTFVGRRQRLRGTVVLEALATVVRACPRLRRLSLTVRGRCEWDRPTDPLGSPSGWGWGPDDGRDLRVIDVDCAGTNASSRRVAAVVAAVLTLPSPEEVTVRAAHNDGLGGPGDPGLFARLPLEAPRALRSLRLDLRGHPWLSGTAAARWCAALAPTDAVVWLGPAGGGGDTAGGPSAADEDAETAAVRLAAGHTGR